MSAGLAPDGLPPLREVIARHGLNARKALGQNFLLDLNLTARIARASGPLAGVEVVEVGPGPGGLTRALLAEGAARVVAIERDPRCLGALAEVAARYPGRLEVVEGDALEIDPRPHLSGGAVPARVVANLPYNVGTELLVRWLTPEARREAADGTEEEAADGAEAATAAPPEGAGAWPPWWQSLTLMFQREVAERIVARPGTKAYGRLAVLAQWRAEPRIAFDVAPSAFVPPPKVTSAVIHLRPAAPRGRVAPALLGRVVAAAFAQRRKMLRQSLRTLGRDPLPLLAAAEIEPTRRAETLSIGEFIALARAAAAPA